MHTNEVSLPQQYRVLVVDDEENARRYLISILSELFPQLKIYEASNPHDAILSIKTHRPEIVLLDVEMPGMTGLEMLRELREHLLDLQVVFVSSYKRAEFIQQAMRLNARDYIDKPVDPEELRNALNICFEHINAQQPEENSTLKVFTDRGEMVFRCNEILYFETNKRYAIAHFVNGFPNVNIRQNLILLEKNLPPEFLRVSRQYIVNKQYIKITSRSNHSITLFDGSKHIVLLRIFPGFFNA